MATTLELLLAAQPRENLGLVAGLQGQAHDERDSKEFISRCLGTNRLLGGDLAEALTQVVPALEQKREALAHLSGLTRSHVVLADALDDHQWDAATTLFLEEWREGVKAQVIKVLSVLGMPAALFDEHEATSRQAYEHFDFDKPLKSVRRKLEVFF